MHHDISISTDGRGEMGVQRHVEGEVVQPQPLIVITAAVLGQLHAVGHDQLHHHRLAIVAKLFDAGSHGWSGLGVDFVAMLLQHFYCRANLLLHRTSVPTDEGLRWQPSDQLLGDPHVGQQHELLHQMVGCLGFVQEDVLWGEPHVVVPRVAAFRVRHLWEHKAHLAPLKAEAAVLEPFLAEDGRDGVEVLHRLLDLGPQPRLVLCPDVRSQVQFIVVDGVLQDRLSVVVGHPAVVVDDGLAKPFGEDLPVLVHPPDHGERKFVLVGIQAAVVFTEDSRQHGDRLLDQVDRGTPLGSLFVSLRTHGNEVGHVRDVDPNLERAVWQLLAG
mmetsp:Transcript_24424/g.44219  ORF Transcript_24424/g.44219 Transcript_24424/m.44219 type:complete len:329 (+) Transcript_24424:835-1821(+)